MNPPTRKQQAVLDYIKLFMAKQGYQPAYSDICEHFGFRSKQAVTVHVKALHRKGYLTLPERTESGHAIQRAFTFPKPKPRYPSAIWKAIGVEPNIKGKVS